MSFISSSNRIFQRSAVPRRPYGYIAGMAFASLVVGLAGCGVRDSMPPEIFPKSVGLGTYIEGHSFTGAGGMQATIRYSLSQEFISKLKSGGLSAFDSDLVSRDGKVRYKSWAQTPMISKYGSDRDVNSGEEILAVNNLGCFEGMESLRGNGYQICEAITSPGNYYAYTSSGDLIIIMTKLRQAVYVAFKT